MNRFILGRPLCKIKRDIKIYAGVVTQLLIAFGLLNVFLSLLLCIHENKEKLRKTDINYHIEIQSKNFDYGKFDLIEWGNTPIIENEYGEFPFTETVINEISGQCKNSQLDVTVSINIIYLGNLVNLEEEGVTVCYSSSVEKVICSERLRKILLDVTDENTINAKDFPHIINNNYLITQGNKEYEIEYNDDNELIIYMPIEIYYNLYHPKDLRGTVLSFKPLSQQSVLSEELNIIISQLRNMYSDKYVFGIESEIARFLDKTEVAEKEAKFFIFVCMTIFIIVLIGMIGIFIMIVNRGKKEIAICFALGQTKKQILFEIFGEISILTFFSYIMGMTISCAIMGDGISVATVIFKYHNWSGIVLFILSVLLSWIGIIPVRLIIKKMSPIDILSSL